MSKRTFCVVIPAFNEEKVITASLRTLKKVIKPQNIYVVSDGSNDSTVSLAKQENVNVMKLCKNWGKTMALDKLIKTRKLTKRYKYVLFSDADSRLDKNFFSELKKYTKQDPALVVGRVASDKRGLISAFRTYEYGLSHRVYKNAQNIMKTITVAPGCASLYKSEALDKLNLKNCTLTEDFDLTIQIHQKKLGQIMYAPNAIVTTQDPINLRDYWKQIVRWNTGTWQNIFQYKLYKPNAKLNLELYLLLMDNVLWIFSAALFIVYPIAFLRILATMYLTISTLSLIVGLIEKKYWIISYIPLFPIFYFINIAAYFYSIFRILSSKKQLLPWNKVERYSA